jgi:putative FmdB family regulatory protein
MPIYEYYCRDCNTKFELLRTRSQADSPPVCKHCDGTHTTRTISLFAAHANGQALAGSSGGCGSCTPSGACASCHSH